MKLFATLLLIIMSLTIYLFPCGHSADTTALANLICFAAILVIGCIPDKERK